VKNIGGTLNYRVCLDPGHFIFGIFTFAVSLIKLCTRNYYCRFIKTRSNLPIRDPIRGCSEECHRSRNHDVTGPKCLVINTYRDSTGFEHAPSHRKSIGPFSGQWQDTTQVPNIFTATHIYMQGEI